MRTPRPGPTSSTTSSGVELREPPDHAEDVVVDEEVLAELAVGSDGELHGSANAADALASMLRPALPRPRRGPRELLDCEDDVRGLVGPAAPGLRREVWAVRLGEDPLRRDLGCRGSQVARLRVRDVAGERDVVAPLEDRFQQARGRKAVHDDRAVEAREDGGRVGVRFACVDDDRLAEIGRELELRLEELALPFARRAVAEVIESRLPHGDRTIVLREVAQILDAVCLRVAGLMRIDADRGEHLLVQFGELEGDAARVDAGAHGHDPLDARRARAPDERRRPVRARVEVCVGVDHSDAAARASIRASSSGTTTSGSSFLNRGRGF